MRDLRRHNRETLLRALYFGGPATRGELSAGTGLSAATVSNIVVGLVGDGVVAEAGSEDSDGGRPRTVLRVDPRHAAVIGVDVGETRITVELFDLAMTKLATAEHPLPDTHARAPETVVERILAALETVVTASGVNQARVLGVGIGVPGIVEPGSPALVHARGFGWDGVPLLARLADGTDLPLFVDNGAATMGRAELWFGAGRGARHVMVALIGTGIGGSLVADGRLYRGAASSAGEWGHTTVEMGGRRCRCGGAGCVEAYAGAPAILARYAEAGGRRREADDEETAVSALVAAAAAGEDAAQRVLEETAAYLGAALGTVVNLFAPERIVVGGWAGLALGEDMLERLRRTTAAHALPQPFRHVVFERCHLGPDAVALGAATLVVEQFLGGGSPTRPAVLAMSHR